VYFKFQKSLLFEVSDEGKKWVDSVYNAMTFDEKWGSYLWFASNKDDAHYDAIENS
jgi:hypothetical protein